jgi:hypothetical protein
MQTEQQQAPTEQRHPLLRNHVNIDGLAHLLGTEGKPVSERSVYNEMDRLDVPYVRVLSVRWYDIDAVRAAILAREVNRQPRGRGRPANRKAA